MSQAGEQDPTVTNRYQAGTIIADGYVAVDSTKINSFGGGVAVGKNLTVGTVSTLGDNGVGVIELANATTIPSTNPVGGALIYATGSGTYTRDSNGDVWPTASPATNGGVVNGAISQTLPITQAINSTATVSQTLVIASCFISGGYSVGHIGFVTSTTAASSPTHWWTALLDKNYTQLAHSADQLTGAIVASTWFPLAMVTPFVTTYSGNYYLAVLIATSVTQPTLASGPSPIAAMVTGAGALSGLGGASSTGITAPGTDGVTVYSAPTATANVPFLYAAP